MERDVFQQVAPCNEQCNCEQDSNDDVRLGPFKEDFLVHVFAIDSIPKRVKSWRMPDTMQPGFVWDTLHARKDSGSRA